MSVAVLAAAVPPGVAGGEPGLPAADGRADTAVQPRLVVAPIVEMESPGRADCRLSVSPLESLPAGSHIRVAGLPAAATLSNGRPDPADPSGTERVWDVPLQDLEDLRVEVPRGVAGSSELHVTLIDGEGHVLAERTSQLRITAPAAAAPNRRILAVPTDLPNAPAPDRTAAAPVVVAPPAPVAVAPPEPVAPALKQAPAAAPGPGAVAGPPQQLAAARPEAAPERPQAKPDEITTSALSPSGSGPGLPSRAHPARPDAAPAVERRPPSVEDLAQAERLVGKGDLYLAQGNIAVAREYFERAADLGLPVAAMRMAETLDPRELARRGVQGVKSDVAAARRWYQRALDLNVPEADARLRRLGGP